MSENETQAPAEDEGLRKRLLYRIAAAAIVIVGLLAGLAAFDALNKAPEPQQQATVGALEPPPAAAPILQARPEATPPPEPAAEAAPAVEEKLPVVPEQTAAPEPPPLPEPKEERPLTKPATAKLALHKPARAAAPEPAPVRVAPEQAFATAPPEAAPAPPSPVARVVAAARRYLVQVGVFSNPVNAEELRARLVHEGIPAQIESRVQVGPFKTRKEAAEARKKLAAMGIEPGIVMAVRR